MKLLPLDLSSDHFQQLNTEAMFVLDTKKRVLHILQYNTPLLVFKV